MSFTRDAGEVSAIFRPAADLPRLERATSSMLYVALGSTTGGEFGLFRRNMKPKSGGPDPHFHKTFSESFYVLDGTIGLYDGAVWLQASAGDFLYVPKGGIHAFRHDTDATASMLVLFAPGPPRERFFEEAAEIAASGRQLTDEEWTEFFARHDQHMV